MENKSSTNAGPLGGYVVGKGAAIITFAALPDSATMDVGKLRSVNRPGGGPAIKIMSWGKDNDVPSYREELITGNNIVPALIERKRNILCGQGWYAYTEKFEPGPDGKSRRVLDEVAMPEEADAFFKKFNRTAPQIIGELLKHNIAMPEFIRGKYDKRIISIKSLEVKYVRPEQKNKDGEIPQWWWSNYWKAQSGLTQEEYVLRNLPVFKEGEKKQPRFVLPLQDDLFNDGYFPIPAYWGGRHWINLSNIIPLFHEANLKHGATPRFHIIIPHDFFFDYAKMNAATTEAEQIELRTAFKAAEQAFVDDINSVLTGIGNAGRTIYSKSEIIEHLGGKYDKRITIEEIKFDFRDEALLKLYSASNIANVSAQAMPPQLASIDVGGKGIGSGTEIRNAFLLYLIIAAPVYRNFLQEIIELVKKENGWPKDIHYAIRDAEMTTLAENPSGVQSAETPIGT